MLDGKPIIEKRRGGPDRHKPGYVRPNKYKAKRPLTKWERRKIVAWDGEGANLEDGRHVYNLLANSEGTRIINHEELGTKEVLDFFLKYGDPRAINVIYGGSYDVNMFLKDLPEESILHLHKEGYCFWKQYKIWYSPRKKFTVTKVMPKSNGGYAQITFTLWDVIGYFQTSFVNACRKWLGELPILDEIEDMKLKRSYFSVDQIEDIVAYNQKECLLLVQLMNHLLSSMDVAELKLKRYDGAGSIASALLSKNGVRQHKGEPPDFVIMGARYAYSGGRIEPPMIGNAIRPIYRYDINSAYPSTMLELPSYKGATWDISPEWDGSDNSLVHITWAIEDDMPFYPLWFREPDGTILYPQVGEGVYWGSELRNMIDVAPDSFEVIDAINVTLATDEKPFAFVKEVYDIRREFKAAGNMANEALKLGINSLYGKLAQQAGYRNGRIPSYHQLLWAGQVTAATRRKLFQAAMQKPHAIIAFATDAVISTEPLDLPVSSELGEWTHDSFEGITIVQAGVYWLKHGDSWGDKYRGFDKGSLIREHVVGSWLLGVDYEAKLTRFVGMGSALASTRFQQLWRTWQTSPRILGLQPGGKRIASDEEWYWEDLCHTKVAPNLNLDMMSKPYPLLWAPDYSTSKLTSEGVSIDMLESEYLDSYA